MYPENEIWRDMRTKGQGSQLVVSEQLYRNRVVVKYAVDNALL